MKRLNSLKQKLFSKKVAMYLTGGMSLVAAQAQAAVDVTAVISGITDAGVAIMSVITALMALSVSLFGIVKVYHFVSKKSGA